MGRISVNQLEFDEFGIKHDRRFLLVDEQNEFITQRSTPLLSQFTCQLVDRLSVSFNDEIISINSMEETGDVFFANIWEDNVEVVEVSQSVSAWFSKHLNKPVKLVKQSNAYQRIVENQPPSVQVGFADAFPMLIANTQSYQWLTEKGMLDVGIERFRANVVFDGTEAFEEDYWQSFSVNNKLFEVVKPCSRCIMPSVNPETLEVDVSVAQTLAKHRKFNKRTYFGQNVVIEASATQIKVGDEIKNIKRHLNSCFISP